MTLRDAMGGDARRIHELVDELLDGEDSLIVLIDGRRAISFVVLYFDWRAKLQRRILAERDGRQDLDKAA